MNIIIVDDININRFLLKEYMKTISNVTVLEATNGQECIDIINDDTKLIFMDIMMPVLNGIEATKIIKQIYPHIVVIGITGQYPNEEHKIFDMAIYKPYTILELKKVFNQYFN